MPNFSRRSREKLDTCHPVLRHICEDAIKIMDFSVICGERGEEEQNRLQAEGRSHAVYGESKHNLSPSEAVDIAPYPIDWEDEGRFRVLAGVMIAVAYKCGIKLKWGGHFRNLKDLGHFEIEV
jgi:peptidoglycan L-alanyl-D-glutamate endopeptidase CwlK